MAKGKTAEAESDANCSPFFRLSTSSKDRIAWKLVGQVIPMCLFILFIFMKLVSKVYFSVKSP